MKPGRAGGAKAHNRLKRPVHVGSGMESVFGWLLYGQEIRMLPDSNEDTGGRIRPPGRYSMTRSNWIAMVVCMGIILTACISASAHERGLACLNQCRANLKERGLWNAYPYGYCRNKCGGQWGPAEKYRGH
jgi:hypothetical protein